MARLVEVIAAKSNNQSSIPGVPEMGGENRVLTYPKAKTEKFCAFLGFKGACG